MPDLFTHKPKENDMSQQPSGNIGTAHHARTPEYERQLREAERTGNCPFCVINRNVNPVDLAVTDLVRAWKCQPSYDFHARHVVIKPKRHVTDVTDATNEELQQLLEVANLMLKQFHISNYAAVMRSGDPRLTGSTLRHIHLHIQEPNYLGPAFSVFSHATSSAQVESMPDWYVDTFLMRRQVPNPVPIDGHSLKHWWDVCEHEDDFVQVFTFRGQWYRLLELMNFWQALIRGRSLAGSSMVVRRTPTDRPGATAKIIIPIGNGPVIEVFAPALNEDQARWQMGSFLAMAKKFEQPKT